MLDSSLLLDAHFHLAAANIMQSANSGSIIARDFSEQFWKEIFEMGLVGRIAQVSMSIAGIGVIYKGYYYLQDVGKNTLDIDKVVGSLMAIVLTILMLSNSGSLAMSTVKGLRNFGGSINQSVMKGITVDIQRLQSERSLSTVSSAQPFFSTFKASLDTCAPKAQAQCYQNAVANLQRDVATLNPPDPEVNRAVNKIVEDFNSVANSQIASNTAPGNTTINPSTPTSQLSWDQFKSNINGVIDGIVNAPSNLAEFIIGLILTGLTIGFYLALELTLIMFGLTFPINIALSLFDSAPLKNWFGNFWLLINAKLCFCIIVGIISYLQLWVQTSSNNALMSILLITIQLLMAFYAPIITFFYVQGSALALAGAMNSVSGSPIRGAGKAAKVLGGKVGGSFMGGVMKGAGIGGMGQKLGRKLAGKK